MSNEKAASKAFKFHDYQARLASFKNWAFDDIEDSICTSVKLAEAGFFRPYPRKRPDLAECYICLKPLEGWEEQDDPWTEHKSHMPTCPLSKLRDKGIDVNNLTVEQRIKLELERGKFLLHRDYQDIKKEFEDRIPEVRSKLMRLT
ncbi:DgyrCDS4147 [Dimorphilus gyrociliatus]|uniref:DgyrCDS4147 n=1 Tax=Dimorphilus gyrociliatus TaxID=2664684 RepID=A0A7I8VHI3_9ANNE|nr:DgyrCDS4147 [Dimorphilus gyrociliatus]